MKSFDKGSLKHVDTDEKKYLPTAQGTFLLYLLGGTASSLVLFILKWVISGQALFYNFDTLNVFCFDFRSHC